MKKQYTFATAIGLCALLAVSLTDSSGASNTTIAFFAKIIPMVSHKAVSADWVEAKGTDVIQYGDKVRTSEKALAIIKFVDKSIVKLREKSELTVTGDQTKKDVLLHEGVIGFSIGKQEKDEEFRFTSPTSVAAIRGTEGLFESKSVADTLIVAEGVVELTNRSADSTVSVRAGFTGISGADGSLLVVPSTLAQRNRARAAIDSENLLEIDLRDGQGNRKKLRIDFKE
jgi:ferric-dicitrate binding protein FerR (iron transport regulator)